MIRHLPLGGTDSQDSQDNQASQSRSASKTNRVSLSAALVVTHGLLLVAILLVACGPVVTPQVVQDFSRPNTLTAMARPSETPAGPTRTPSMTPTPYARPTDAPDLDLLAPIVRVGDEVITLGDFRARVRYERFVALDDLRRTVDTIGLDALENMAAGGSTPPDLIPIANAMAGVLANLANTRSFGFQVYEMLVRDSIIRQEFERRTLEIAAAEADSYWVRRFGLQTVPADQRADALRVALDLTISQAAAYSGLTHDEITGIVRAQAMANRLSLIIAGESLTPAPVVTWSMQRITTADRESAERAISAIRNGSGFREAACLFSIEPAVRGAGGDLGFVTRGRLPGIAEQDAVFDAEVGAIVGPLQTPLGWSVYRVAEKRQTVDGDSQSRLQVVTVASQARAVEIRARAEGGDDFATLACSYSLDESGGTGGDLGRIAPETLAPPVQLAIAPVANAGDALIGPVETGDGYEILAISDPQLDITPPAELEQAARQAFSRWQADQRVSGLVEALDSAWQDAVPTDPLPRDVAPFLAEGNFDFAASGPQTPTPRAVP